MGATIAHGCQSTLSVLAFAALLGSLSGCQSAIPWTGYAFEPVHEQSRREGKLTFVYFRDWASPRCTRFEEEVLSDPEVRPAVSKMNTVAIQWNTLVDRPRASQFGIDDVPGVAIVSPTRTVLESLDGAISKRELLDAISRAREQWTQIRDRDVPGRR